VKLIAKVPSSLWFKVGKRKLGEREGEMERKVGRLEKR